MSDQEQPNSWSAFGSLPTFEEVLALVARGRELSFTTGSPIEFKLADGRTATILIHPDCVDDAFLRPRGGS